MMETKDGDRGGKQRRETEHRNQWKDGDGRDEEYGNQMMAMRA